MKMGSKIDGISDEFPVGMRVLAVDDNPPCLMLLETLLRKCQYNVTTARDAITALELMRENKNKFDLVISDVDMPDMDGFKLLEYVGIEMDLPVIMLSAHGDKELVMKGITHGACDYLLKPVRIEELKNIWQHVWRRKNLNSKDGKNSSIAHVESGEVQEEFKGTENTDNNEKLNKKRKDKDHVRDGDDEEHERHYEDSSTQKKPRVVWNPDLHRKFVAAVNQLGLEKAVPKRILELMNVDKLTRENVASHLQKYRIYLRKYRDAPFHNVDSVTGGTSVGVNGVQNMALPSQRLNAGYRSYQTPTVVTRLNTPASMGLCGLSSSGTVQWGQSDNIANASIHEHDVRSSMQTGTQSLNVLHGMPMLLDYDNKKHEDIGSMPDFSSMNFDSFHGSGAGNWAFGNNTVMLEEPRLGAPTGVVLPDSVSTAITSVTSDFASKFPGFGQCDDSWPAPLHSQSFSHAQGHSSDLRESIQAPVPIVINSGHTTSHHQMPGQNMIFQHPSQSVGATNSSLVPEVNNMFVQRSEFHMNDAGFNLVREYDPSDLFAM